MPTPSTDRLNAEDSLLGTRLDSWKEIANYLCRAERTVKRWETDRGLPIHRVPGGGRGSVYAYMSELTEWLNSSPATERDLEEAPILESVQEARSEAISAPPVSVNESAPTPLPGAAAARTTPHRKWIFALAGLVLAGIAVVAIQPTAFHSRHPWTSTTASSLFAKSPPKASPTGSRAVSVAEQRLSHDLYLRGRYQWNQRTPDSLNRALDSFTQSIVHDPGFAQAYVGLADTYDLLREYSTMPDRDAYPRAIAAAEKAVELDDSLSEAHRALAFAEFWGNWDFVSAEREFHRAIELDPKDPVARRWYANSFAVPERIAECLKQIDKAEELDPSSPATLADKGMMLFNAGKTDEAIELLEEVKRSNPEFRSAHFYLMGIDLSLRRYKDFLAEGQKSAEIQGDPVLKGIIGSAREGYARAGGRGLLENLYTKQREYYRSGKFQETLLAKTCVLMGRKQEALDLLEDAYARHEPGVLVSLLDRELLTLNDEPRFRALIKKINFPNSTNGSPGSSLATNKSPLRSTN